ncbi:DDB1- and CUL4-associated factor 5-like [Teleopsis dalmanni]|uniref:DDB1- and CUL4-associated factor 5-like n=1 Tax=Teleopsis dalmanni TaxID=139649 RepID=UPI0018CF7523|nr:DDB1- and CUL4-associated factor 5-like [Teleopsis dalmanni]
MRTWASGSNNISHQLLKRENNIENGNIPQDFMSNLYRSRFSVAKNLYKTDLVAHYGCVNALEFSNGDSKFLASGGDDRRVLIWDIEKSLAGLGTPRCHLTEHNSNIFCLAFDKPNRKILSGSNDNLVLVHDLESTKLDKVFILEKPVYGLCVDPKCEHIFASACEDGQVLIYDQRQNDDPFVLASLSASIHAVEYHPIDSNFLISANSTKGSALWDLRKPNNAVLQYGKEEKSTSCMSVRFNYNGTLVLSLSRRLPPILYNKNSPIPVCTFYSKTYYNSCTMKSCTFAGTDDELIMSGSDDFNLYAWRLTDIDVEGVNQWVENPQMVLYGHRSIVNQVRYNREKCLIASSGVDKSIKIWSPFQQSNWSGSLLKRASCSDDPRPIYRCGNIPDMGVLVNNPNNNTTREDPRMLAFFDNLVQQEIEQWGTASSSSEDSSSTDTGYSFSSVENEKSNRITYLIATKRETLRQKAIKHASFGSATLKRLKKHKKNTSDDNVNKQCNNSLPLNNDTIVEEPPTTSTGIVTKDNTKRIPAKKLKLGNSFNRNNEQRFAASNAGVSKSTADIQNITSINSANNNVSYSHSENRKHTAMKRPHRQSRIKARCYRKNNIQESDSE